VHLDQPAGRLVFNRQLDPRNHADALTGQVPERVDAGEGIVIG